VPRATVIAGACAILRRRRPIVGGGLALGPGELGLIRFERIADRGADVSLCGRLVSCLRRAISGVRGVIGLVPVLLRGHGAKLNPAAEAEPAWILGAAMCSPAPRGGQTAIGMPCARWSSLATPESVSEIRQAVVDFAWASGITDARTHDIGLAVSEAVSNAVVHAYRRHAQPGAVYVSARVEGGWIELVVVDDGIGIAPRSDSPGLGLGLPLINRLADQVELRRRPDADGTELWMRFRMSRPATLP
jgi:serine/threonine-protein kinase RsbW/stage II sporulation protein AB (anti-sigma F factor)